MKKILLGITIVSLLGAGVAQAGFLDIFKSSPSPQSETDLQKKEQRSVTQNQEVMERSVGLPQLNSSLERANIKRRLELFSDEAKISYIYLVSYGKVMAFHTVKGKITSGGKRLTSGDRQVDGGSNSYEANNLVMESPELDGTYGNSSPYIFFWTTEGTYVQWNGEYMLADQPLKLTQPPELIREVE
mgnify:CR=1 FL=1